jgi:glutamate carboxypeptidase
MQRRQLEQGNSAMAFARSILIALAFSMSAVAFGKTPPTKAEQALTAYVQKQHDASVALLERVVDINSGTMNFAGVRQVADVFKPQFEALGFTTEWVDGQPFGRAGHLVARHLSKKTGKRKHVLLIGHLDTVFEPTSSFQKFTRVDANRANGPGTSDMKGGIVVALAALGALKQIGALDDLEITFVMHGDEEDSGAPIDLARKTLIDAAKAADVAIGLENAADNPATAVIGRRSAGGWRVEATGITKHSSQIFTPDVGAGAVYELARILNAFYFELHEEENLTFNPGLIVGGAQVTFNAEPLAGQATGKDNIVVPRAIASGDIRAITREQQEHARERMTEIVAAHLPRTSATITFSDGYPPMAPTDGNRKLLSMYDQVSRDLGYGPVTAVNPRNAGAADVSFAADHVEMAIDGLGLLGGNAHTPSEFADLKTLQIQAQRLAVLLYRLGR